MADLDILQHSERYFVTVDASATTFLAGYALANDGSGNWVLADADAAARMDAQWLCLETVSAGGPSSYTMPVAKRVIGRDTDSAAFTAGGLLYLSATPGIFTQTAPTLANGTEIRVIGKAISANEIVLNVEVPHYHFTWAQQTATVPVSPVTMFIAPRPMRFIEGRTAEDVVSTSGTVDVYKASSGTRLGSGTAITTGTASWSGTAGTPVMITPSTTAATARVATGQQVGLVIAGTLTGLVGAGVSLVFVDEQLI